MKATAGEVYTVYNQYLKRYTACQLAYIAPPDKVSKQPWAVVLSLDWAGDAPLTAEELPHLRPLYKDFMYWPRDLHLLRVPLEVPPQYKLVGTLPSFTDQSCRSYGGWSDGYDVYLQIRWQAIPEERRRAFKEAMESEEKTEIGGIPVKVSSHRVTDQYEPFDSALELKALPCLSTLICQRWHPDLLEFLQENPFIDEMTLLSHGQRTLDLRGTSIRKLKYWIITCLVPLFSDESINCILSDIQRIAKSPTQGELREEVHEAAVIFLQNRLSKTGR